LWRRPAVYPISATRLSIEEQPRDERLAAILTYIRENDAAWYAAVYNRVTMQQTDDSQQPDLNLPSPATSHPLERCVIVGALSGLVVATVTSVVFVLVGSPFGPEMAFVAGPLIGAWIGLIEGLVLRNYVATRYAHAAASPSRRAVLIVGVAVGVVAAVCLLRIPWKWDVARLANYVIDLGGINVVLISLSVSVDFEHARSAS